MIETECHLWGKKFDPTIIASDKGISISDINKPGELGKFGKYKGKPTPYGSCRIITPENIPNEKKIIWLTDLIKSKKQKILEAKATEIEFYIYWYGIQGNMELSVIELKKISELNIPLIINYIESDEDKKK